MSTAALPSSQKFRRKSEKSCRVRLLPIKLVFQVHSGRYDMKNFWRRTCIIIVFIQPQADIGRQQQVAEVLRQTIGEPTRRGLFCKTGEALLHGLAVLLVGMFSEAGLGNISIDNDKTNSKSITHAGARVVINWRVHCEGRP